MSVPAKADIKFPARKGAESPHEACPSDALLRLALLRYAMLRFTPVRFALLRSGAALGGEVPENAA
jgi:hypothetical protein